MVPVGDYIYLIVAFAVVFLGTVVGLVATRARGGGKRVDRGAGTDVIAPPEPRVGEDAETPRDAAKRTIEDTDLPDATTTPTLERPETAAGRLVRLRQRLARSQGGLGRGLLALLSRDRLDEDTWEDIEDILLTADVGVTPTQELVERLRARMRVEGTTAAPVRDVLREELLTLVDPTMDRALRVDRKSGVPGVALVVGVNGTGKTTTVGKLALALAEEGKQPVLAAADTFRAAATEQLAIWADRVGAPVVRHQQGADPAAVAFDGLASARARGADVLLVDTAGRLHTKTNLMEELRKLRRVLEREGGQVREVLLVLDATTGQNGLAQARQFTDAVGVTGVVLTKLDGTAKGGIVIAVQRDLGIPVKLVGLGEGPHDLAPFDPDAFVDALLSDDGA
jgi:fused signal recognition particle receptor